MSGFAAYGLSSCSSTDISFTVAQPPFLWLLTLMVSVFNEVTELSWNNCFEGGYLISLGLHWEADVAEEPQLFLIIFQSYQFPDWAASLLCKL